MPFGKPPLSRKLGHARFNAMALALAILFIPAAAAAAGDAGPVSSDSITISVSVAARYKVQTLPAVTRHGVDQSQSRAIRFCIATNSAQLPVQVNVLFGGPDLASADRQAAASMATPLARCADGQREEAIPSLALDVPTGTQLMLVRPE